IIGHDMDYSKFNFKNKYVIGVDEGAYQALKNGIKLDVAIGDFDSIDQEKLEFIESQTKVIQLPDKKNDTDTSAALKLCKDASRIIILGGIQGKRIEHFIANLMLMETYKHVEMLDNNSHMYIMDSSFSIKKTEYKFISFFALSETIITLEGFKYPLNNYDLKNTDPLTISNELAEDRGIVTLKGGRVLVIQSKEDVK
ncbi:MAG: thiamine diphosphokinase, partial [Anaeroplasmataceae bacterium]|nr:thiamine diphosphokinase [Anaeroplasmataceae bacterium]